jgi:hypothetical protein
MDLMGRERNCSVIFTFKIKDKFSGVNNKNLKASTFSNFRVPKPKFDLESSYKNIDDNVE